MTALGTRLLQRRGFLKSAGALASIVAVDRIFPHCALALDAQTARARCIGVLATSRMTWFESGFGKAFESELARLGWQEGRNLAFEYRFIENDHARASPLEKELIDAGIELLVVGTGATSVAAAKRLTSSLPIVMINARDPVKFSLVSSLSRPGGNVTGLGWPSIDWGKYLELGRELLGAGTPIGLLTNPRNITNADYIAENEAAARRLGIELRIYPAATVAEIREAVAAMAGSGLVLAVMGPDAVYAANIRDICAQALKDRLAIIGATKTGAHACAVASLTPDFDYIARRASWYVDRILRGAKPAELPVEQPDKFVLIVNLKAAKAIGTAVPQSVLLRADEVIE